MANHTSHRVEVVCFDAMYTIIEPLWPRHELLARIIREVTGIRIAANDAWSIEQEIRGQHPRSGQSMEDYWERVNHHLLLRIGVRRDTRKLARRMHELHLTEASNFTVRKDMRELLAWASERTTIAVTSNHRHRPLRALLEKNGVAPYFGSRVFSSGRFGYLKPSRKFCGAVRNALGLRALWQLALVGNSFENDVPVASLGIRTLIFDRSGTVSALRASLPAGVSPSKDTDDIRAWISEVCELNAASSNGTPDDESRLAIAGAR